MVGGTRRECFQDAGASGFYLKLPGKQQITSHSVMIDPTYHSDLPISLTSKYTHTLEEGEAWSHNVFNLLYTAVAESSLDD